MEVVGDAAPLANRVRAAEPLDEVRLRRADRVEEGVAEREPGADRRRQRAPGAMRVGGVDARARELQGDARADAQRRLAELDQRQRELSRDAEELKNTAADKLDALKAKINDDLEKLKRAYAAAEREIKK